VFVTQAYEKMVKTYQEELEKQRKKDEEERKRYREMVQRQKRMLEAAFGGDNDEILAILKEVNHAFIALHYIVQFLTVIECLFANMVEIYFCYNSTLGKLPVLVGLWIDFLIPVDLNSTRILTGCR